LISFRGISGCRRDGGTRERGAALVVTMAATLLLSAMCAALVLATSTESLITGHFRAGMEAHYAAEAAANRVLADLAGAPDWDGVLSGGALPVFADGAPSGTRTLEDGSVVDLSRELNLANCGKLTACSLADIRRVTAERPWGLNNPQWRLHAYGSLSLASEGRLGAPIYVVVLVADDPAETDDNPLQDGRAEDGNPGAGVVLVWAEAFGFRGARRAVRATLARSAPDAATPQTTRVVAWHRVS
jgi:hypothetical protein